MFEIIVHSLYITWSTGVGCVLTFKIFVLLLLLNVPTCRDISLLLPLELKRLFLYGFYISSLKDFAVNVPTCRDISLLLPLELKRHCFIWMLKTLKNFAVKCFNVQEHFLLLLLEVEETVFILLRPCAGLGLCCRRGLL